MALRQAFVRLGHSFVRHLDEEYRNHPDGVEYYIACTRMNHSGVWVAHAEIFALSHLIKTSINNFLPRSTITGNATTTDSRPGEWCRTTPRYRDKTMPPTSYDDMEILRFTFGCCTATLKLFNHPLILHTDVFCPAPKQRPRKHLRKDTKIINYC